MSKKMWNKIFKSSKSTKNAKISPAAAAVAVKSNKRCSIYEEYQQLNGYAGQQAETAKKPKKLYEKGEQEQEQGLRQEVECTLSSMLQQHEASADERDASAMGAELDTATTSTTTTSAASSVTKNSEIVQMLANSANALTNSNNKAPAQAVDLAGANDQLIGNKNNNNNNSGSSSNKQQSTFAKVVSSFTLKRSNNNSSNAAAHKQEKQQQKQKQKEKENGNVNATGKLPKCEFRIAKKHATPTNKQQQRLYSSSHALQQRDTAPAQQQQQQYHQEDKRSSQILIVIKQIVTTTSMPNILSDTKMPAASIATKTRATHDAAQLSLTNNSQVGAVTDIETAAFAGLGADEPMHSSAAHDNAFVLAANSATTITTTSYSTPTITKTNTTTRATKITTTTTTTNATNTNRLSISSTHSEKNNSNTIANTADPYPDAPTKLVPCPICRRTFNPVTLQKHVGICEKMATKRRNVFDSSRQRREGTELASYPLPKNFGLPPTKQEPRGQSPKPLHHIASPILTRKKSNGGDELTRSTARASMRKLAAATTTAAHAHSQSPSSNTAPTSNHNNTTAAAASIAPTTNNTMITSTASTHSLPGAGSFTRDRMRSSDRALAKRVQQAPAAEQCPHCERCFGLKAYDRHVEWCKEKALQASIKQTSKTEQNLAKERLEARTKYRAPCLKTKRSINRDKYAGLAGDEFEFGDTSLKTSYGNHSNNTSNSNNSHNNNSSNNNNSNIGQVNGVASSDNSNANGIGNSNGIMSLSMTSSMTSERKPILKDFHTSLGARKTHRNAIELPPPSPTHHAGGAGIEDFVKSACFDNLRLTGSHLSAIKKKIPKRRITVNTINMQPQQQQQTTNEPTHMQQAATSHAPPQSSQFEKPRSRSTYDERLSTTNISDHTREHNLGDANALSATLTYTACPLKAVTKPRSQSRNITQSIINTPAVSKPINRAKPAKVSAEQQQSMRVDAATVMTDQEEPVQRVNNATDLHNNQTYESQQQLQLQQQLQQQQQQSFQQQLQRYAPAGLTTPMQQMLQKRQTTFDKLPNTTIAVTTLETATSSVATTSHTKLEVNAIRSLTICRPKRKKLVRQTISTHATPMKAIPLLKESIKIFGAPTKLLNTGIGIGVGAGDGGGDGVEQLKHECVRMPANDEETDDEIKVIKAPPKLARDKSFVLSGLPSADKYDPFLSAKRQLEELCSSSPPNNASFSSKLPKNTTQTPSSSTSFPTKMSTSLTLSTSMSNASPLTTPNAQNTRNATAPTLTTSNKTTPTSNFRRASSLRGPRRSPLLSSRPLFAQNHRPTIQRGLSDEGPISTNFLKPEEYDEMPVRSVCVNDYALTKSPRVTRRDNSLSNRKQSLKLNVQGATATTPTATTPGTNSTLNTPNYAAMLGGNSSDELIDTSAKYLSKTDSLAAFLKYEKELDKLNAHVAADASVKKPTEDSALSTPAANLNNPVITKEFKEKSNTLSKQNSAKSLKSEHIETEKPTTATADKQDQARAFQHLPTPVAKTPPTNGISPYESESVSAQKSQPLRPLEPIISLPQATSTPIMKSNSARGLTTPNASTYTQLPAVNLNALLGESTKAPPPSAATRSSYSRDLKNSTSSSDYIDPKLINKCDNLPVKLNTVRNLKTLGSSNNIERHLGGSSSSSECSATQTGPISQLTKLLPLTRPATAQGVPTVPTQQPTATAHSQAMDIPNRPATTDGGTQQPPNTHATLSQRSSAEGRNLLNRKKRLGRNHFLYDASPEADDSCSADDEANRSSVEYYESKYRSAYQQQQQQELQQQQQQHQLEQGQQPPETPFLHWHKQPDSLETPPIVPPLPIFDDFDFEEFLSSFENDDEQLPLFKDCREFLLNRTSNKQRSTLTTPSSRNDDDSDRQQHLNNNTIQQQQQQQTKDYKNKTNHFEFPQLVANKHSHPTLLLTPSSRRSRDESGPKSKESSPISARYDELKRSINNNSSTQSGAYGDDTSSTPLSRRNDSAEHKKREIFISIETEPNEHGRSPISPDSLRNMVGNPQTMVEVEVDGCDNKFSKISDDDEQLSSTHHVGGNNTTHVEDMMMRRCTPYASGNHLPNVQLNNAKNLIQRMQNDFRQMSEEVGANIRQAMTGLSSISGGGSASMLYGGGGGGGEQLGMGSLGVQSARTYAQRNASASPPPPTPPQSAKAVTSVGAPLYATSGDVSGDACGDSDDMSSLDGYPISSKSSRRGVGAKLSADSAYGSLSRQRSSELSTTPHRSATRSRPTNSASTVSASAMLPPKLTDAQHYEQQQQQYNYQQQQQQATQLYKYAPVKTRPRHISASSSSENSDGSDCNIKYKQQLQQQQQQQLQHQQLYGGVVGNNNSNNNNYINSHYAPATHPSSSNSNNNNSNHNNIANNNYESPLSSPTMPTASTTNLPPIATINAAAAAATVGDMQSAAATTSAETATSKAQYSSNSSLSSTNASAAASTTTSMSASMKMSKFCHECGAKFLIEQAKFCMDCGVRRIVL